MAAQPTLLPIDIPMPAKPFLKWAGGKGRLVPTLKRLMPKCFNRYIEPFVGGGAFCLALAPRCGVISDLNAELVDCYRVVRDEPVALEAALSRMIVTSEEFYRWRAISPGDLSLVERAARFIYLNKTCFNGLYRVNRQGQFNAPFGRYKNVSLADIDNLYSCSKILSRLDIRHAHYRDVLNEARSGDFVYLDPPYVPVSKFSDFSRYTSTPFTGADQEFLAKQFADLHSRGCFVLLSNSKHPVVEILYKNFLQTVVKMPRFVNCKGDQRGEVEEVLVTNYELPIAFS